MKKIETCRSISELYVKLYVLILVHLMVLSIKLSTNIYLFIYLRSFLDVQFAPKGSKACVF